MSDVDRLRTAAHMLDIVSVPTPLATACAALLRAVADDVKIGLYIVGAESPAAALALASVILGGTDD